MFETVAFAFVASLAFVAIGRTVVPHHHPDRKAWKRIHAHDRVYYMKRGHRK